MARKGNSDAPEAASGPKERTRTAPFMTWAREKKRVPSALGAAVALGLNKDLVISEADFDKYLEQYGSQKSFKA